MLTESQTLYDSYCSVTFKLFCMNVRMVPRCNFKTAKQWNQSFIHFFLQEYVLMTLTVARDFVFTTALYAMDSMIVSSTRLTKCDVVGYLFSFVFFFSFMFLRSQYTVLFTCPVCSFIVLSLSTLISFSLTSFYWKLFSLILLLYYILYTPFID